MDRSNSSRTPQQRERTVEKTPSKRIVCRQSQRYERSQSSAVEWIPYVFDKRSARTSWSTVSKAAERSSRPSKCFCQMADSDGELTTTLQSQAELQGLQYL